MKLFQGALIVQNLKYNKLQSFSNIYIYESFSLANSRLPLFLYIFISVYSLFLYIFKMYLLLFTENSLYIQYLLYNIKLHVIIFYNPPIVHGIEFGGRIIFWWWFRQERPGIYVLSKEDGEGVYIFHLLCYIIVMRQLGKREGKADWGTVFVSKREVCLLTKEIHQYWICLSLSLWFLASKTMRKKLFFFMTYHDCGISL